ncbi:MAG: glycoside hydrolase domain-containing protein [Methylocystis sp.]|uniref:glycoside hydrolase domain-containing protein n=1 Tax=Methylocystis sp. TaxID=1911079 RepID=UPI003DA4975E
MCAQRIVEQAAMGLQGFDANTTLTASSAAKLKAAGFSFAIRYLSRRDPASSDLTADEADIILASGLALMAVQHVERAGWEPSEALGSEYGANAAANAAAAGLLKGVTIWLDLEGVNHTTSAETVIDYCNAWFAKVQQAGYVTGIYVGANSNLSGDQLYWRLKTRSYWKSGSNVPDIPERGIAWSSASCLETASAASPSTETSPSATRSAMGPSGSSRKRAGRRSPSPALR